jgi:hypothetical protein
VITYSWKELFRGSALVFAMAIASAGCTEDDTCSTDLECSDGLYCNGEESCSAGKCEYAEPIPCDDGIACTEDVCNEVTDRCEARAPDRDGDGVGDANCVNGDGESLGRDCDDADPGRFGGNLEVCDIDQVDEDCDPATFGNTDADGDGFISGVCCNADGGVFNCGSDCDDDNVSIYPGAMICHPTLTQSVQVCKTDGLFTTEICEQQGSCFPQPNGTGVCVPL